MLLLVLPSALLPLSMLQSRLPLSTVDHSMMYGDTLHYLVENPGYVQQGTLTYWESCASGEDIHVPGYSGWLTEVMVQRLDCMPHLTY